MRASRDRTDEFLALAGCTREQAKPAQRANIAKALAATDLPAAQVQRVVLHEIELAKQSATNAQEALHWHEVERLYAQRLVHQAAPARQAATALTAIERKLEYVSTQFETVLRLAASQGETIGSIERNIESIHARIDSSQRQLEDAAPRQYHTWRLHRHILPRTLAARLQCLFGGLLAANLLFIYTVLL